MLDCARVLVISQSSESKIVKERETISRHGILCSLARQRKETADRVRSRTYKDLDGGAKRLSIARVVFVELLIGMLLGLAAFRRNVRGESDRVAVRA